MVSSIEISFKSSEDKLIKNSFQQILEFIPKYWVINSIQLPNKIKKITILRSPHIDKKSREQFQMKIFKRKIALFPNNFIDNKSSINEIYLFLENMKQCPFSGIQIQIQIIYKCYI
jgi:small subunit ribosomal protein S10